jgi:isopenicillin N synthase-like dioxygenase
LSVPVIDFARSFSADAAERGKVADKVHDACRNIGFFYVSGHRVARALIDAQFAWTKRFFDLRLEDKLAIHMKNSPTTAGYEPVGAQVLDSQDARAEKAPADLK